MDHKHNHCIHDYFHYQRQNEHRSYAYNYEFVAVLYPSMFYN
jgi:hypothetical protein